MFLRMAALSRAVFFSEVLIRRTSIQRLNGTIRMISQSPILRDYKKAENLRDLTLRRISEKQKRMMVAAKMYKKVEDVPDIVRHSELFKAKEWYRIYVSITVLLMTILCCILIVIMGKYTRRNMILEQTKKQKESET